MREVQSLPFLFNLIFEFMKYFLIRITLSIVGFILQGFLLIGQQPMLVFDSVGICADNSVNVPLRGKSVSNMGAMTLYIDYSGSSLTFVSVENVHPSIKGLLYNSSANPPRISLVWSSTNGINFFNDIMLELKFNVVKPEGGINFAVDSCEVADAGIPPQLIDIAYVDGKVYNQAPVILQQPANNFVPPGGNCFFSVQANNTISYRWQESRDFGATWSFLSDGTGISGTSTSQLNLNNLPESYSNFQYRCEVSSFFCSIKSQAGILKVDKIYSVPHIGADEHIRLVSTNPFFQTIKLECKTDGPSLLTVEIFDLYGKVVFSDNKNLMGVHKELIELNVVYLPVGCYTFKYTVISELERKSGQLRLIKVQNK
jgi:hypothetical protein